MRKYGFDKRDDSRSAALVGLIFAASRYRTPSEATFGTFALRTIDWTIRLLMLREMGVRDLKRKARERVGPPFDLSDTCACEPTPDQVLTINGTAIVDRHTPESRLLEAERLGEVKRVVGSALAANPPRSVAMLLRNLDGEPLSCIAVDYGISRERVRQLVAKAMERVGQLSRSVA